MFDPYNRISFVELNRIRRGEKERAESDKIYNQPPPTVKRIFLQRNNENARPKLFIWRVWKLPRLEALLAEGRKFLGLEENEGIRIYDSNGIVIENEEQVTDGNVYVIAGSEDFYKNAYNTTSRSASENPHKNRSSRLRKVQPNSVTRSFQTTATSSRRLQNDRKLHLWTDDENGGYKGNNRNTAAQNQHDFRQQSVQRVRTSSAPSCSYQKHQETSLSNIPEATQMRNLEHQTTESRNSKKFGIRLLSHERQSAAPPGASSTPIPFSSLEKPKGTKSNNDAYNAVLHDLLRQRDSHNFNEIPPVPFESAASNYGYSSIEDWQSNGNIGEYDPCHSRKRRSEKKETLEKQSRNQELEQNLSTERKRAPKRQYNSNAIYNRPDQTHPDAYIIYVFLNGHGLESQCIRFQKTQLERGMSFVLELIAKGYGVKPAKICNMDGHRVRDVMELMSRGAYVLVPVSQSFRDAWYFLPDNAIDTSADNEKIRQRDIQKQRLLQRRDRHLSAIYAKSSSSNIHALNLAMSRLETKNMQKYNSHKVTSKKYQKSTGNNTRRRASTAPARKPQEENLGPVRPGAYFSNLNLK